MGYGEQYTIQYEKKRVGLCPHWISIDSNLVGYDIRSVVSEKDSTPLLIEVKATNLPVSIAAFHVTANEWEVASTAKRYLFYLWCFSAEKAKVAMVEPDKLKSYIPTNNLSGEWESVRIPFSSFEMLFNEA